jgi:hypothetical protein
LLEKLVVSGNQSKFYRTSIARNGDIYENKFYGGNYMSQLGKGYKNVNVSQDNEGTYTLK